MITEYIYETTVRRETKKQFMGKVQVLKESIIEYLKCLEKTPHLK